jgi:hypothetical protein
MYDGHVAHRLTMRTEVRKTSGFSARRFIMKSFAEIVKGIAERHESLLNQRNQIDAELAEITAQFGGIAKPKAAKVKAKVKAKEGAKRGRPVGSVNKATVAVPVVEKRGMTPDDILVLHVLPAKSSGDSVSRQGCTAGLEKHGWTTKSAKKDTVVGQALTRLRNKKLATIISRGQWALSAAGERLKEKMVAAEPKAPKAPKVKVAVPAAVEAEVEAPATVLASVPFEADAAPAEVKA